jgi:hypothetical protein
MALSRSIQRIIGQRIYEGKGEINGTLILKDSPKSLGDYIKHSGPAAPCWYVNANWAEAF